MLPRQHRAFSTVQTRSFLHLTPSVRHGVRSPVQRPEVSKAVARACRSHHLQVCPPHLLLALRPLTTANSHVFCSDCADTTGLSRSTNAHRTCPACNASLHNPDDVVVAGLSPSEDYKTSVLSGLSPTIIMECASRALAFHGYQTSQEIIYQEHLAKGLTDKYDTLSQQMDQLIHDANAQIKALQDKMQGTSRPHPIYTPRTYSCAAMQAEQEALETKNFELAKAYKEKTIAHQRVQNHYQALKGQVNLTHVARAAGNEAAHTLQNARGDRFIDRLPGTRTGTANYSQINMSHQAGGGRMHNRDFSRSSENSGRLQQSGIHIGPPFNPSLQRRVLGGRNNIGRELTLLELHRKTSGVWLP